MALVNMIQIDMFEVQLGASLLLQFRNQADETVRVLADAGVKADGYPLDHVHGKLPDAFNRFGDPDKPRIDLIVGTHYDADHLDGLVPIIDDMNIEIGEAWLPPVANDTDPHAVDDYIENHRLLAVQFAGENGLERLKSYLKLKRDDCEKLRKMEMGCLKVMDARAGDDLQIYQYRLTNYLRELSSPSKSDLFGDSFDPKTLRKYFAGHFAEASAALGESSDHRDDISVLSVDVNQYRPYFFLRRRQLLTGNLVNKYNAGGSNAASIAFIRSAAAADAINASSLFEVVQALRKRQIPICCNLITNGQPRRFVWQKKEKRFIPGDQLVSDGPEFMLLGPSRGLVKKHWDRLPIGDYLDIATFMRLPVKSITPSNQLSYVLRINFEGQGVLVTGDAGCVDFKMDDKKQFYPELLNSMLPLHVIQVAHHGGNNSEFYNVLLEAGFPKQTGSSFLLLSHATYDRFRPSELFADFVAQSRKPGDDFSLLFTSQPDLDKVKDYEPLIYPVVGTKNDRGDVRLVFNNSKWSVLKHAIQVY